MPEKFNPEGALRDCFDYLFNFAEDFEMLVRKGYIEVLSPSHCKWLKSKTSLAEYFKNSCGSAIGVPGGFWAPIEKAFGIKRHSLRRLAGKNANVFKRDESIDYLNLKPLLRVLREQEERTKLERRIFIYIKNMFHYAKDDDPETIRYILGKIAWLFSNDE